MEEHEKVPMVFTVSNPTIGTCMWDVPEELAEKPSRLPEDARDRLMATYLKLLESFMPIICALIYTPEGLREKHAMNIASHLLAFREECMEDLENLQG